MELDQFSDRMSKMGSVDELHGQHYRLEFLNDAVEGKGAHTGAKPVAVVGQADIAVDVQKGDADLGEAVDVDRIVARFDKSMLVGYLDGVESALEVAVGGDVLAEAVIMTANAVSKDIVE